MTAVEMTAATRAHDDRSAAPGSVLLIEEGGVGGVAEYTAELAAALARAGWAVHVATARDGRYPPAPGVTVHGLFPYVRGTSPVGRLVRRLRLSRPANGAGHLAGAVRAAALARRVDAVHVQSQEWPPLGAVQALLLRAAGRRFTYTPHNTFDRGRRSYRRAHALIHRCARTIVVHARHDLTALEPAAAAKAVVIPHGDYGALARRAGPAPEPPAARARLGVADDELLVLLFGQLRPDKGPDDLVAATATMPRVRAALAGADGGALRQLEDQLAGSDTIVCARHIGDDEVGDWFAAADVVALPYRRASASGVLLLAYGYGRPVVAYPVGGLPEYVVDGQTGWLCARPDREALRDELAAIAAAGREECRRRGAAGQRLAAERFDWDGIARRTAELYGST